MRREQSNLERSTSLRSGGPVVSDTHHSGRVESIRSNDRTDALWAEMQATLEEVELSASGGTHVFGHEHDRKLSELRTAQIALAQAWARSEADDTIETTLHNKTGSSAGSELRNMRGAFMDAAKSSLGDESDRVKSAGEGLGDTFDGQREADERLASALEEETEMDIVLARKRREANDRYFQRVNNGVIDVVAKLEDVAVAMRAVEQESKDVWNDSSVVDSGGH